MGDYVSDALLVPIAFFGNTFRGQTPWLIFRCDAQTAWSHARIAFFVRQNLPLYSCKTPNFDAKLDFVFFGRKPPV